MDDSDLELKLLSGEPIEIEEAGYIYIPRIKDIVELSENKFNEYLSLMLIDKSNFEMLNTQEISSFELIVGFSAQEEKFYYKILEVIQFFFKQKACLYSDDKDVFFLFENGKKINAKNFNNIQSILKAANFIKEKEEYKPANEAARKMVEMIKKNKKNRPKTKEIKNLHSIISGMAWKANNVNILNIFDLTVYQLYDGYARLNKIDDYSFTLQGIYSGNVDGKSINFKEMDWAKILEK